MDRYGIAPREAAEEFCRLLARENTLLVAHNAQFDLNFLYFLLRRTGGAECLRSLKFLDALTVYRDRRDYPHKLKDAIAAYRLEDRAVNSHGAVDDARAMMELLWAMAEEKRSPELCKLAWLQSALWCSGTAHFLRYISAAGGSVLRTTVCGTINGSKRNRHGIAGDGEETI